MIYGELPTRTQLDEFRFGIRRHTLLHEDVKSFFNGFPKDAHPMAILSSVVSTLSTFYQDSDDPHDPEQVQLCILRLMAKIPTIAAYSYKKSIGQPFLYPDNRLDLIENFLTMMFAVPSEPYAVSPTVVHALKQLLILHADHEQNCSTSTVRMVGSSDANLFASIAAGINACGARCTAARTRPSSRCSSRSATVAATSRTPSSGPRTRTTRSASRASGTASTRTTTRAPRSSRAPRTG